MRRKRKRKYFHILESNGFVAVLGFTEVDGDGVVKSSEKWKKSVNENEYLSTKCSFSLSSLPSIYWWMIDGRWERREEYFRITNRRLIAEAIDDRDGDDYNQAEWSYDNFKGAHWERRRNENKWRRKRNTFEKILSV